MRPRRIPWVLIALTLLLLVTALIPLDPIRDAVLPESNVRDLVALTDGRLAVASFSALVLWDPAAGRHTAVGGIPGGSIQMLELDRRVAPATLHVATEQGAAALRVLP